MTQMRLTGFLLSALMATALLLAPPTITSAHAQTQTGYLDAVEDMPLMEGLSETGEGGIVFDKPTGRIVRAAAQGRVGPQAVRAFYIETLPALGWDRAPQLELFSDLLIFRREGERLEIQIAPGTDVGSTVRFSIEPE